MSVYIQGVEMPKRTPIKALIFPDGRVTVTLHSRDVLECQAVPVPEHGDLISYDYCINKYELLYDENGNPVYAVRMMDINAAPTIIPGR